MKVLITGGSGFIGSHFVRWTLNQHSKNRVLNVDALTYAGRGRNLADLEGHPRYSFERSDIAKSNMEGIIRRFRPDAVLNFAAESHVDRSIYDALSFLHTNTVGTQNLLSLSRKLKVPRFVQISTDEVYGSIPGRARAREDAPLLPSSAYSASKAAADLCVLASHRTHQQDVVITRCTNNYGPYQFPEKLIPLMITNALSGLPLPIYGDGRQRRDWIHVEDHCAGIALVLEKGRAGEIYNFGMGSEPTNLSIVSKILDLLQKPKTLIQHVVDRPGHDRRYAVDTRKARRELGWKPRMNFEEGLRHTVDWYRTHVSWWIRLRDARFRSFYQKHYKKVL